MQTWKRIILYVRFTLDFGRVPRSNTKYLLKRLTYIHLLFLFIWFSRYWRWRRR